jgi:3-isopropylmalate/(R)-2-methylmalate dehydratase small subunit
MVTKFSVIEGRGVPLPGSDIDTDRIMPARYLKGVTFEGLEQHVFEDDRAQWLRDNPRRNTQHPFDDPRFAGASILIVNSNFGCGSSREHAPQGLQRWGIQAVIGESFAEIYFGNSVMIGMPCVTAAPGDVRALMERVDKNPKATIRLDLVAGTCDVDGFRCAVSLPPKIKEAFTTGAWDTTGLMIENFDEVNATAAKLPYVAGF